MNASSDFGFRKEILAGSTMLALRSKADDLLPLMIRFPYYQHTSSFRRKLTALALFREPAELAHWQAAYCLQAGTNAACSARQQNGAKVHFGEEVEQFKRK